MTITTATLYHKLHTAGLHRGSGSWQDFATALRVIREIDGNLRGHDVLQLAWLAARWLKLIKKKG